MPYDLLPFSYQRLRQHAYEYPSCSGTADGTRHLVQ